jgi:two-component system, OmpR family, sensor histidine kinase KdpD
MPDIVTNTKKILVCVGSGSSAPGVIRAARRKAGETGAKLFAVHVEAPRTLLLPESERERALDNMQFAEKLGAETATLSGRNVAESIIRFAANRNVTGIVMGKPKSSWLKGLLFRSPIGQLVRNSGKIDVEIVSGDPEEPIQASSKIRPSGIAWSDYGTAVLFLILATGLCFLMFPHFDLSNLIMVYLTAVMVTAIECGRGPAVMASVVSVLSFDFFFVPPYYTFTVDDAQYIVTFVVMFVVAMAISHLTVLMRRQTQIARLQERQAAAMHGLSRQLAASRNAENTLKISVEYISEIFDSSIVVLLPGEDGKLMPAAGDPSAVFLHDFAKEMQLARKAFESSETTGLGTSVEQDSGLLYVPLAAAKNILGVLAVHPGDPERLSQEDQQNLLVSLANQVALSLEVEYLGGQCTFTSLALSSPEGTRVKPDSTLEG